MPADERRRRSRWMIRVLEWDDPRAKYPNVWHDGMPIHILAFDSVANRMRLGDLVAVYHPASQRHPDRADRFLGLCRVEGLRRAHAPRFAWVDLSTVHRFSPALSLGEAPRRVFLCCDPEWPDREVALFRKVFDAAVAAGWKPSPDETERGAPPRAQARGAEGEEGAEPAGAGEKAESEPGQEEEPSPPAGQDEPPLEIAEGARLFAGADLSGDMRDPRDGTWIALLELLEGDRLRVVRLDPTGRTGLQTCLRDSDAVLLHAEAVGLDFPFGLPRPFAEKLLGGPFPEEGWWALAKQLEKMSRPEFLGAVQDFLDDQGDISRRTDEQFGARSPLHRGKRDKGAMSYHGIRMIAEERSRYAVRPFETAKGRLLLEVYPRALVRRLSPSTEQPSPSTLLEALTRQERLPVEVGEPFRARCLSSRDALDAVLAARCAAEAVMSGETERSPEELAPGNGEDLRREGWIYGLGEPAQHEEPDGG